MLSWQQLRRLANEATALSDWMIMRDFANQIYGEGKVAKIHLETYADSNDEGGLNYYIEGVTIEDTEGKEVRPDYTLPFFQSDLWDEDTIPSEDGDDDEDDYDTENRRFIRVFKETYCYDDEKKGSWLVWEDLPDIEDDVTYDLTKMPPLSFTVEPIL